MLTENQVDFFLIDANAGLDLAYSQKYEKNDLLDLPQTRKNPEILNFELNVQFKVPESTF